MSTERALLVRLSGNEPNAGGDWVEYHYSPIYINTGNTGIYLEHSLEVSGETRFQSGVYAGKSLSVSGLLTQIHYIYLERVRILNYIFTLQEQGLRLVSRFIWRW